MNSPIIYMELSDVARELGLSHSGVYVIVQHRRLIPDAVTRRGINLFLPETIAKFKQERNKLK